MVNVEGDGEHHHSFAHSLLTQQTQMTFFVVGVGPEARAAEMNRRPWPLPWGSTV